MDNICSNITGVSPFAGDGLRCFALERAISAAVSRKRNKYLDKCLSEGYSFGILAFTTLGELGEDMIVFLKRLGNCLAKYDVNNKIGRFLFHRIGLAIHKGVRAQIVTRLPTISNNSV